MSQYYLRVVSTLRGQNPNKKRKEIESCTVHE